MFTRIAVGVMLPLLMGISFGSVCLGQTPPAAAPLAAAPTDVYRIAPEDKLDITVAEQPDLPKTVQVTPDGKISYPYVGEVVVAGMTPSELTTRLERGLAIEYIHPQVTVSLEQRHALQVSVLGAVKTPGKYDIKDGWHILDALAAGGGLAVDRPEWSSATLIRNGTTTLPVDMARLMAADPSQNLALEPNDVLLVQALDASHTQVQVLGAVVKPGPVAVPKDGSMAAVIAAVGGPTPEAALSHASLLRDGQSIPLDLRPLLASGTPPIGVHVEAGDTVVVPQNRLRYAVLGAVSTPGSLEYPDTEKLTLLTALSRAGGQTSDADTSKATLIRPAADGGNPTMIPVNLDQILKKGEFEGNVAMNPGDILYLPSKSKGNNLRAGDFIPLLGLLRF